jgi:hypothetical protein
LVCLRACRATESLKTKSQKKSVKIREFKQYQILSF